jgi:hypothetical protein
VGSLGTLLFASGGNTIGEIAITGGGDAELNNVVIITDSLKLTNGTIDNTSGLTMADGATITRSALGFLTGDRPIAATDESYNVLYSGGDFTGSELPDPTNPTERDNLNDLIIDGGPIALGENVYVNGRVILESSTLNCSTFTIHMQGTEWLKNGGNFDPETGFVVFNNPSGTTITGASGNPLFGNFTLASTGVLNMPSTPVNIQGNILLNPGSTFNANGGSVNLTGDNSQTIAGGGSTFNDINVNKSAGNIVLSSLTNLIGKLEFISASTIQSNGNLTILSTSAGTTGNGHVATIPAGAQISGDVNVQRFMGGEPRIYRYIASAVEGTTVADWQNDFPITGTFDDPSDVSPFYFPDNPSMFYYDETIGGDWNSRWVAYPTSGTAASNPIVVGRGYSVYTFDDENPIVWTLTGDLNQGTVDLNVTYTNSGK